jgi:hypothetical protein
MANKNHNEGQRFDGQNRSPQGPHNAYSPGHAQNKDQLNHMTDRKDNQDVRNPKPKHKNDR